MYYFADELGASAPPIVSIEQVAHVADIMKMVRGIIQTPQASANLNEQQKEQLAFEGLQPGAYEDAALRSALILAAEPKLLEKVRNTFVPLQALVYSEHRADERDDWFFSDDNPEDLEAARAVFDQMFGPAQSTTPVLETGVPSLVEVATQMSNAPTSNTQNANDPAVQSLASTSPGTKLSWAVGKRQERGDGVRSGDAQSAPQASLETRPANTQIGTARTQRGTTHTQLGTAETKPPATSGGVKSKVATFSQPVGKPPEHGTGVPVGGANSASQRSLETQPANTHPGKAHRQPGDAYTQLGTAQKTLPTAVGGAKSKAVTFAPSVGKPREHGTGDTVQPVLRPSIPAPPKFDASTSTNAFNALIAEKDLVDSVRAQVSPGHVAQLKKQVESSLNSKRTDTITRQHK